MSPASPDPRRRRAGAARRLTRRLTGGAAPAALLVASTACRADAPMSMMDGRGYVADRIASLGWGLTIVACAITLLVTVILLVGLRRRSPDDEQVRRRESGVPFILAGGVVMPVVILTIAFVLTMRTMAATATPAHPAAVTAQIIGHRWWWEVRYQGTPQSQGFVTANELHVPVGQPVKLVLLTDDVIHSFWVPSLAGKTDLIPGQRNEAWIQADSAGVYRGQCTEYCGPQHANMAFTVVADPPERYAEWAAQQRAEALAAADPVAQRGRDVFLGHQCVACHAIRGTDALGTLGPDLTHLASRGSIGAGALPNTPDNLRRWIHDSQDIKPDNEMPPMPLPADDLRALVAYLGTLK